MTKAKGLLCPECMSPKLGVLESRPSHQGIRRRRHCLKCDFRFTTHEGIELVPQISDPTLIKIIRRHFSDIARRVNEVDDLFLDILDKGR